MISVPYELSHDDNNPLDMVEELAEAKSWDYNRMDDTLIALKVEGQKAEFEIFMEWQEEFSALLFSCSIPVAIDDEHHVVAAKALEQINQSVWMGHFDLSNKGVYPTFRQTMLFRLIPSGIAIELIDNLCDLAIAECNRFYTTFQLIQAGDETVNDNIKATLFETIGEA